MTLSDLDEDCDPTADDTLERMKARDNLALSTMAKHAKILMNDIAAESGSIFRPIPGSLQLVLEKYKEFRDQAEKLMKAEKNRHEFGRIDRHKLSAAFMMAILAVKPLRITNGASAQNSVEKNINQILAFKTAVSILAIFIKAENRIAGNSGFTLSKAVFPKANGVSYVEHAYSALFHASMGPSPILTLPVAAHWMFYIEKFWTCATQFDEFASAPTVSPDVQDWQKKYNTNFDRRNHDLDFEYVQAPTKSHGP